MTNRSKTDKTAARKKFVEDFSRTMASMLGKDVERMPAAELAYLQLAVAQCMDAAIINRKKLDVKFDDGYVL